jgi:hypothetical protein
MTNASSSSESNDSSDSSSLAVVKWTPAPPQVRKTQLRSTWRTSSIPSTPSEAYTENTDDDKDEACEIDEEDH